MKKVLLFISSALIISIVYSSCTSNQKEVRQYTEEEKELLAVGKQAVESAFATLSGQLKQALAEGGVPNAIPYCKNTATSITDSLSKKFGFEISRTSMKVRNPENKADAIDRMILGAFESQLTNGREPKSVILDLESSNELRAYYPIVIKPMCKNCHGVVSREITEANYKIILENYPNDEAVNFFDNSLRGAWKVIFNRDNTEKSEG